jgi:hypothetical protein
MPTGWTATWGSGKPVIARSDLDDIKASRSRAWRATRSSPRWTR